MEGAWFHADQIDTDSFESDRHNLPDVSFEELFRKYAFTAESGRKQNDENFAYLPSRIHNISGDGMELAQWNYRILCHPLRDDLPLDRFRPVDDLTARMRFQDTYEEYEHSGAARFQINPRDMDSWKEVSYRRGLLDELFEQIPGKDNYPADLQDNAFGLTAESLKPETVGEVLNTGYYHRW